MSPATAQRIEQQRTPWGVSRMSAYPPAVSVGAIITGIDPATQLAMCESETGETLPFHIVAATRGRHTDTGTGDGKPGTPRDRDHLDD